MKWLFLRGLIREARHWHQFPRQFKQAFPKAEIGFLEVPGTGQRYHEISPLSISEMVQSLESHYFTPSPSEKPYILSISMGGMIVLEWLKQYPDRFAGAVLINTSISGISPFHHRLQPQNLPQLLKLFLMGNPETREKSILNIISNEPLHHQVAAKKFGQIQQTRPVSRSNALRQIYAASRFRLDEKPEAPPLLLLNGEGDRLVSPRCTAELSKFLGVPFYTHPSAGHDLPLDAPDWILEQIKNWLNN